MTTIAGYIQSGLNRLLPFTNSDTPIIQDCLHLAIICVTLYYAPHIQLIIQNYRRPHEDGIPHVDHDHVRPDSDGHNDVPIQQVNSQLVPHLPQDVRDGDNEPLQPEEVEDGADGAEIEPQAAAQPAAQPPDRAPTSAPQRAIGAKKAKSLARRDQKRAYHEFMRSQGEAQRARDAEGAAERTAAQEQEQQRRAAAEAEISERAARARDEQKTREGNEREAEMELRRRAIDYVQTELDRSERVELDEVVEKFQPGSSSGLAWIESLIRAAGIIKSSREEVVMTTSTMWLVRVTAADMDKCYDLAATQENVADDCGRVSFRQMGDLLARVTAPIKT